jgi:hypothetical protein
MAVCFFVENLLHHFWRSKKNYFLRYSGKKAYVKIFWHLGVHLKPKLTLKLNLLSMWGKLSKGKAQLKKNIMSLGGLS